MSAQPDLFGDALPTPPKPETISRDRRRTLAQQRLLEQGIHPLTRERARPDRGTCGSCRFRELLHGGNRSYPKCTYGARDGFPESGPRVSHGAGTDVRAAWPACSTYAPKAGT